MLGWNHPLFSYCIRMTFSLRLWPALLVSASILSLSFASQLEVVDSSPSGITLELRLSDLSLNSTSLLGEPFDVFDLPGGGTLAEPGEPALPFLAELIAAPPGSRVEVEVEEIRFRDLPGVRYAPALAETAASLPELGVGYSEFAFKPAQPTHVEYAGLLRGVEAHALRIYPVSFNGASGVLRVYDRLRVRLRFIGGPAAHAAPVHPIGPDAGLYAPFLNAAYAQEWSTPAPAAKSADSDWYDSDRPWIKVFVDQDALYRIDRAWLERRNVDVDEIDPNTLRLLHRGTEQPIHVSGAEDGRLDAEDRLLFYGKFRRDHQDFESIFGRRNTYWLTWGEETGGHLQTRSSAPVNDFPAQRSYWTTTHFERDLIYAPFASAPDNDRDHWFWDHPILATKPDIPSSRVYSGLLDAVDAGFEYDAHLRFALHGETALGHHTVVQLNNSGLNDQVIDDSIWAGQTELIVEKEIPVEYVERGTNRLLVKVFADQEKFDEVYLNWFEIGHYRLYRARVGYLEFEQPADSGHRIVLTGFKDSQIELYDLANGIRYIDAQLDTVGEEFGITFEAAVGAPARYVAADSSSMRVPTGLLDTPSQWKSINPGADYLVITHARFAVAAQRLAEHRRDSGLRVEVVDVQDVYDEFSDGLLDRNALYDFVRYAYENWPVRPAYLVLFGDATYDYRNIIGAGLESFVPTQYYQARQRGQSPSDFEYALLDGDDLLPDLAVGRFAVESQAEAERIVERTIAYELDQEPGDWRSRVMYVANDHQSNFIQPSDDLATTYTEPLGLRSVKIYNPDEAPIPNPTGVRFVNALNDGALLLNYAGHGSIGSMASVFAIDIDDWGYLGQVNNGRMLPLVLALSCLNGLFVDPLFDSLGEALTRRDDGGAIAYISASAKSFVAQNNLLSKHLFNLFFVQRQLEFGPSLNNAKIQVLIEHPSFEAAARTMQLFGDPAQKLGLPPEPDYAAVSLSINSDEAVFGHSSATVEAVVVNNAVVSSDSVRVSLLVFNADKSTDEPDTLWYEMRAAFAGSDTVLFDWPVADRRGLHRLALQVDPDNAIAEGNETNNEVEIMLQILEPLVARPIFPPDGALLSLTLGDAAISDSSLVLQAVVPLEAADSEVEFMLATSGAFTPDSVLQTALATPVNGLAELALEMTVGSYFWRARLVDEGTSEWSAPSSFRATDEPTAFLWSQTGTQLQTASTENVAPTESGGLTLASLTLPLRPSEETRDDGFTVRDLAGAGVLCTDGTYLYAKRWYNDDTTIYPGTDFFARIGTGFNGTRRDLKYGDLADTTTAGISATYHSDGFIYNDSGKAFELERIHAESGRLDTIEVAEGLLEWQSGMIVDGHSLFTSDGRYIYNASMSSEDGIRNAWRVRVFDPADGWSVVRDFTSPPTQTGFTYKWTDGLLADGERLYFIEWKGERRIRMVDAFDGRFLDEWTSGQEITRVITGQYDWVNNKVWLGDLMGSGIFRYAGLDTVRSGLATSTVIGPTDRWKSLAIDGEAGPGARLAVDLLVQDPVTDEWQTLPPFVDLVPGEVDLSRVDASRYPKVKLQARFEGDPESMRLNAWSVDFDRLPDLQLADARVEEDSSGRTVQLTIRNLSPMDVADAKVQLEYGDREEPVLEQPLPLLRRGETVQLALDSLVLPPAGVGLFARAGTVRRDAEPADNRLQIPLLFDGRAPLSFSLWPDGVPFLSGDPLRPGQGIAIRAPETVVGQILLELNGFSIEADSSLSASSAEGGTGVLVYPDLAEGNHVLTARLLEGQELIGEQEVEFRLSSTLTVTNALIYPNPVREATAFTYSLSHDAVVSFEVFAISGRLVRRLEPQQQAAGFQKLGWDGLDHGGHRPASGTYLFRLRAQSDDQTAVVRGAIVLLE